MVIAKKCHIAFFPEGPTLSQRRDHNKHFFWLHRDNQSCLKAFQPCINSWFFPAIRINIYSPYPQESPLIPRLWRKRETTEKVALLGIAELEGFKVPPGTGPSLPPPQQLLLIQPLHQEPAPPPCMPPTTAGPLCLPCRGGGGTAAPSHIPCLMPATISLGRACFAGDWTGPGRNPCRNQSKHFKV